MAIIIITSSINNKIIIYSIVAIVGISAFGRIIAQFFSKSTYFAKSLEDALDWTAKQQ